MIIPTFGTQPEIKTAPVKVEQTEAFNENQFLDFSIHKVQTVSFEQLEATVHENRGDSNTPMHGIYHFTLIQQLLDMCAQHGYDAEIYDLFATNNRDKQTPGVSLNDKLQAKFGERSVKATTLRRIFCNIRLTNFDDESLTTNMALSYTQRGIQVGFGTMVKACRNQNLLGQGQFVSDYSTKNTYANDPYKTDLKGILAQVGTWLTDAKHIVIRDRETIEKMKAATLTAEQIYVIIGMLTSIRVACDTQEKEIRYKGGIYPLNQSQIGKFTENLLLQQQRHGSITAWSLYNAATELYKATNCEQNNILVQNLAMYQFLKENQIFQA